VEEDRSESVLENIEIEDNVETDNYDNGHDNGVQKNKSIEHNPNNEISDFVNNNDV